jgi:ketosteroid isomerase-like protein
VKSMKKIAIFSILLFLYGSLAAQASKEQDDSLIRASRAKTNELIAGHDIRGLARYYLPDYVRVSGSGVILVGKDSAVAYWAQSFKDHPTIAYVRTPDEVIISDNGVLAWEKGTWTGINTKSKGGTYAAMWSKQDNIWKLQSELYVTLTFY